MRLKYDVKSLILVLLSAGLFALALPNEFFIYGNPLIGLIALVPLFYGLAFCRSFKFAFLLGALFGVVSTLLAYFWLMFYQDFSVWTVTGTAFGYAIYYSLFFIFLKHFSREPTVYRPFLLTAAWVIFEYFKSTGYLGFPYGLMAYPMVSILPLIQIADITGIWGITTVVVLVNALGAEMLIAGKRPICPRMVHVRRWGVALSLIALMLVYGTIRLNSSIPVVKKFNAILVQQNIDSWVSGNEINSIAIGQRLTRQGLADAEGPVDIIMWSETSLRRPFDEFRHFYEQKPEGDTFLEFLQEIDTHLFLGAPYMVNWENYEVMNAVILISPEEKVVDYYGKQHPVPFAEHIPFWEVPFVQRFFKEVVGLYSGGWVLGKEYTIFELPLRSSSPSGTEMVTFGAPICFEDAFPRICRGFILRGADLLINLTNDSWSKRVSAQTQHFVAALFRAVETKRVLVRSTNAGVTSVIGPYGRVLDSLPYFTEAFLSTEIPVYREEKLTPYTLYGDYLPFFYMAVVVGYLFIRRFRLLRPSEQ
jgi:apolipoprotein N-acyltransferase